MSGETHTTGVDSGEVQNMINNSRVEQDAETDRKIKDSQAQSRNELDSKLKPLEDKAAQHDRAIDGLQTGIKDLERDANAKIKQSHQQLLNELDKSEKRQTKQTADRLNQQRKEYQDLHKQQSQRLDEQSQRLDKEIFDRIAEQNQIRSEVAGVKDSVANVKQDVDAVDSRLSDYQDEVDSRFTEQRSEFKSLIEKQRQQFSRNLAAEKRVRQQQMSSLQSQLKSIASNQEQQQSFASQLFREVKSVINSVESLYRHDRFAPGKIEALKQRLSSCANQASQGMWQAVSALAQQVYDEVSDLRLTLAHNEQEWVLRCADALESVGIALASIEGYRKASLTIETADGECKTEFDADYWSKGKLSEMEPTLQAIEAELKDEENLTPDRLTEIEEYLSGVPRAIESIVAEAKAALIASQMRIQMATQVVSGLEQFGYRLVDEESDAVFEGDDDRNAFVVKVKNEANDAIVTVIAPQTNFTNSISINTFTDTLVDEESARQNSDAVIEALQEIGVEVGETKCEERPNAEYRDLDAVRSRPVSPVQPTAQPATAN